LEKCFFSSNLKNNFNEIFVSNVITTSYENINDNLFTRLVFVDLKKAFNTVSQEILLLKLYNYGIRGVAYNLVKTYLTDRQQFVSINQMRSTLKKYPWWALFPLS